MSTLINLIISFLLSLIMEAPAEHSQQISSEKGKVSTVAFNWQNKDTCSAEKPDNFKVHDKVP
ncbi:hypothetical protein [Autumnicola musiva]|uniref:Uncharacterized protein n=1 Tax=Autumnicola musiva TaxID=3075589 RepID=A0ABU3D9Z7_9FLAO|nr:hypothetical protein [Zunongwangia sp. F117]MDT0678355.1 hypothetical protein [Zunongwangia sp. F117]